LKEALAGEISEASTAAWEFRCFYSTKKLHNTPVEKPQLQTSQRKFALDEALLSFHWNCAEDYGGLLGMKPETDHELSAQELQALEALFEDGADNSDRWYLLKIQLTLIVALCYALALLFFPGMIAQWLALEPGARATEWEFIFRLRGSFISLAAMIAVYSYLQNLHMRLIFGSAAVVSFINLAMDLPVFYWDKFTSPSVLFVLVLLVRLLVVVLLFLLYANIDRIPEGPRKLFANPLAAPGNASTSM
jgi:hypothetical protein